MARLTAPISVKGTEPAVVQVRDDKAEELMRRGFAAEESKAAPKKASSSKSDK